MSRADPFRDPGNPFGDPNTYGQNARHAATAAGSQSDLLDNASVHSGPPVSIPNPYARYDDPSAKRPSWMQPDEKPAKSGGRKLILIGGLVLVLVAAAVAIPVALHFTNASKSSNAAASKASTTGGPDGFFKNTSAITGFPSMIDPETPKEALTSKSVKDGETDYVLVFSDEFNTEGRSFYPGDDPYWEGVDLHYWQTGDLEWYEPGQLTTKNGALEITLAKYDDITQNYNLSYRSGMMSTWNKMCFTGGRIEASVMLPGINNVVGLWPAVWAMGNLGRVGYGASLEGMWPYTYDSCDVGTLANQTMPDKKTPLAATENGDPQHDGVLSFLPGQRLSACTCANDPTHPGPKHKDGTFVGRSAPEIDVIEATVGGAGGIVSQSGQWAPFNAHYDPVMVEDQTFIINNASATKINGYRGGVFQQAISATSATNQLCYELSSAPCFSTYGFEYKPGFDGAYISWISQGVQSWTMLSGATAPDPATGIAARPIPQEPLYLITNLGISFGFGTPDFDHLVFPTKMRLDWIRVYQPKDAINVGCDPVDFPTASYIAKFPEAYNNPNLTTFKDDLKLNFPKNSLVDTC